MSLDGKIAGPDDDVKWLEELPNPEKSDYGYGDFYKSVDTTIMGNSTYKMIQKFGGKFPYPDTINYVVTRDASLKDNADVSFTNDPVSLISELKSQEGADIWLIGGGQLNSVLWNEGLVDELHVYMMPIVLGEGISLFESLPKRAALKLLHSTSYSSGVCSLIYSIKK